MDGRAYQWHTCSLILVMALRYERVAFSDNQTTNFATERETIVLRFAEYLIHSRIDTKVER